MAAFFLAMQYYSYLQSGALVFLVVNSPSDPALFARGVAFRQSDPTLYSGNFSAIFRFVINWLANCGNKDHPLLKTLWSSAQYNAVKDVKGECGRSLIGDFTRLLAEILQNALPKEGYVILHAKLTGVLRQDDGKYAVKTDADENAALVDVVYFALGRVPNAFTFSLGENDVPYFWYDLEKTDSILSALAGKKNASAIVGGGNKTAYEFILYAANKGFVGKTMLVAPSPCHFIENSPETQAHLTSRLTYEYIQGKIDGNGNDENGRFVTIQTLTGTEKRYVDTVVNATGISAVHPLYATLPELIEQTELSPNASFCHQKTPAPLLTHRMKLGDKFRHLMHNPDAVIACIFTDETDRGADMAKAAVSLAGNSFVGQLWIFTSGSALDDNGNLPVAEYEKNSFSDKTANMRISIVTGSVVGVTGAADGGWSVEYRPTNETIDDYATVDGVMDMANAVLKAKEIEPDFEARAFLRPKYPSIAGAYPFIPYQCDHRTAEDRASGCSSSNFLAKIAHVTDFLSLPKILEA
ncbi:MAG: hypothetical protein ABW189_09575 [Rickettsiales bacterium]